MKIRKSSTKRDWIATARTLSEALPYLQRYDGASVVIKFGGHAMGDDAMLASFARDVVLMKQVGVNPVIVHGGGPMINDLLARLGIKSEFVRGKRVSDEETVRVVEMVLCGSINKKIVQAINSQGGQAVGLCGKDASLMVCDLESEELGQVGIPSEINSAVLRALLADNFIPVVAPIGVGRDGATLNVNGDTAAGAIAAAMKADRLLLLTDVKGVQNESGELLASLTPDEVEELARRGVIDGGMLPKTDTAVAAVKKGVRASVILDGTALNSVLLELFTDHGMGTLIRTERQDRDASAK